MILYAVVFTAGFIIGLIFAVFLAADARAEVEEQRKGGGRR